MLTSHKTRFSLILIALTLSTVLVVSCDDDNGDGNQPPVTGTLRGTAIFHGDWPDSGHVQLSIFENWNIDAGNCSWCVNAAGGPPAYHTEQGYFVDPDPSNNSDADTISFEITGISLGTYNSIVTGWRAPTVSDIECDEPIVGMYGGNPFSGDSIPTVVTFNDATPEQNITVETFYDHFLPVPGCGDRGRIEGSVRLSGAYPDGGLLVMLTTFPVSGWNPIMGQPTAYYIMESATDTNFRFTPPFGNYYLSVFSASPPPNPTFWYGSYGINTQLVQSPLVTDSRPDMIVIDETTPNVGALLIKAYSPAPHYVSGNVTFTGTRPEVGLLVMVTTTPVSPISPPQGAPLGYFLITDNSETLYAISGMAEGTYYLSLWNNVQGPGSTCYGAYGYTTGSDPDPDPVVIDATTNYGRTGINISN